MKPTPARLIHALCMLLALALSPAAWAAVAGKVLVAVGEVTAVRNGLTLTLAKNSPIESGDTIHTGATSNAQLRFTDGSIVALRPETSFAVEDYRFQEGNAPAQEERGIFSLLKGGLRTVTGLIGKRDQESYQMKAVTATVGIRGTHYNLLLCLQSCRGSDGALARDGLYGNVLEGAIALKNQAQERVFGKDEVFYVQDAKSTPEKLLAPPSFLRDKLAAQSRSRQNGQQNGEAQQQANAKEQQETTPVESPPPPPQASPEDNTKPLPLPDDKIRITDDKKGKIIEEEEEKRQASLADSLVSTPEVLVPPPIDAATPTSGTVMGTLTYNSQPGGNGGEQWFASSRMLSVLFDGSGAIQQITDWCNGCGVPHVRRVTAQAFESGADAGTIAWGRWSNGTLDFGGWGNLNYGANQGVHFVVGYPTATLPTADATVRYTLIGATSPVNNTNSLLTTGLVSASGYLDVNFAQRDITTQFDVTGQNAGFRITGSTSNFTSADFLLSGTTTRISGTAPLCVTGCSTSIVGSFFGTNATHAGVSYRANDTTNGLVEGVAAFKK